MDKFTLLPYITDQSAESVSDKAIEIMGENGMDLQSIPWDDFCVIKGGFPNMRGGGVYEEREWAAHTGPELLCGMPVRELLADLHLSNHAFSVIGTSWEDFAQAVSRKISTLRSELCKTDEVNSVGIHLHSITEDTGENLPYIYFWMVFDFNIMSCVDLNLVASLSERSMILQHLPRPTITDLQEEKL